MAKLMAVPFSFRNKEYYSLVRIIPAGEGTTVKVKIMDSALDRLLAGSNVFHYKDGHLLEVDPGDHSLRGELQAEIVQVLQSHLFG